MRVSGPGTAEAPDPTESALLLRVLGTLLREDVVGLRTRGTPVDLPDGRWLRLTACGRILELPVEQDGFQCEYAARLPLLRVRPASENVTGASQGRPSGRESSTGTDGDRSRAPGTDTRPERTGGDIGRELTTGARVLAELGTLADPEDRPGFTAFAAEYADALAALRLRAAGREEIDARLTARYGADPLRWRGPGASLGFDTAAALAGHPLYPTDAARPGLTSAQLRAYAPEFTPHFALRWVALPLEAVTVAGPPGIFRPGARPGRADVAPGAAPRDPLAARTAQGATPGPDRAASPGPPGSPGWAAVPAWPAPSDLGLDGLDGSHLMLPVHPLTAAGPLRDALRAAGLEGAAVPAGRPYRDAAPTLSMRTVALTGHPGVHLKLPLATSTLGLLNRRTIKPGSLLDGAAGQRLLAAVTAREPRFQGRILHADETVYAHAGHELLAVLVRRLPAGLDGALILPLAALTARAQDGRPVLDHLAGHWFGGDRFALLDALLTLLLDWQTTLFGYGVALESHQQNVSLLLDGGPGQPRVRLLFKDDDGPRINRHRLRDALGPDAAAGFADPRILTDDDRPVLDLFTTITVHLCAAAFAFDPALGGREQRERLLDLIRDRLDEAARRLGGDAGNALRAHVLQAARLPVKAMVTAGTLLTKNRSGASDINKHYTTGPNYLLRRP